MGRVFGEQPSSTPTSSGRVFGAPETGRVSGAQTSTGGVTSRTYDSVQKREKKPIKSFTLKGTKVTRQGFIDAFDSMSRKSKNSVREKLRLLSEKGDTGATDALTVLGESGRMQGSFLDFVEASNDRVFGGITRGIVRGTEFLIPGDQKAGAETLIENIGYKEVPLETSAGRLGGRIGSVQKGVVDAATLVAPTVAAERAIRGSAAVSKLGKVGAGATRITGGSLTASGIELLQEKGRGNDPSAKEIFGTGLAVDFAIEALIPGAGKLLRKSNGKITPAVRRAAKAQGVNIDDIGITRGIRESDMDGFIKDLQKSPKMKKSVYRKSKEKFIDSLAPIEDTINKYVKSGKLTKLDSEETIFALNAARRSGSIAETTLRKGSFGEAIKGLSTKDLDAFDIYLKAKHGEDLIKANINPGPTVKKYIDSGITAKYADVFEERAKAMTTHHRAMLDASVDSGLISKEAADEVKKLYPNYTPFDRIMDDVEDLASHIKGGGDASISTQTVLRRLKGSEREVAPTLETTIRRTQQMFAEIERNNAADTVIRQLEKVGEAKKLTGKAGTKPTISVYRNGVKQTYAVRPAIAEAAKGLTQEQFGKVMRVVNVPTRVFKLGTTGALNPVFAVPNFIRDQFQSFLISKHAASTHNPMNFMRAAASLAKKDEVYERAVKNGAISTFYDATRNPRVGLKELSKSGRASTIIRTPKQLLKKMENLSGFTENLTRMQVFTGELKKAAKEGLDEAAGLRRATIQAQRVSTDFFRAGSVGFQLNAIYPYLNARVQGARTLIRAYGERPLATGVKTIGAVVIPAATLAYHHMSNPEIAEEYSEIQEYIKDNNFVIINPETKEQIKIPISPDLRGIAGLARKTVEGLYGEDPVAAEDILRTFSDIFVPFETNTAKSAIGSAIPQFAKPLAEVTTNQSFFTGQQIVPGSLEGLPANEQVKDDTSQTSRQVGDLLGISPLQVDFLVRSYFGKGGEAVQNLSDNVQQKTFNEDAVVGGLSYGEQFGRRFTDDRYTRGTSEFWNAYSKVKDLKSARQRQIYSAIDRGETGKASRLADEYNDEIVKQFSPILKDHSDDFLPDGYQDIIDGLIITIGGQSSGSFNTGFNTGL